MIKHLLIAIMIYVSTVNCLKFASSKKIAWKNIHGFRMMSIDHSLMMNTPVVLNGVRDIIDRYDIVLLDQYGVLHDGLDPLDGVPNTLNKMQEKLKITVVLSNTGNRAQQAMNKFKRIGLPEHYSHFLTSGEMAWRYIDKNYRGKKCTWVTWKKFPSDDYLKTLDVQPVPAEEADFLFFHGPQTIASENLTDLPRLKLFLSGEIDDVLHDVMNKGIKKNLPAIVANVDIAAITNNQRQYMPGVLMQEYMRKNGEVIAFGKPFKDYFDYAIEEGIKAAKLLNPSKDKFRILHVGDSIHHDIAGAHSAGIDSLLITDNGVHKEEFVEDASGNEPLLMKVCNLCDKEEVKRPTYILKNFIW